MNAPEPTPSRMAPAEGGNLSALATWQNAIGGRAPQFADVVDRKAAADSWMAQFSKMIVQPTSIRDDQSPAGRVASAASSAASIAAQAALALREAEQLQADLLTAAREVRERREAAKP